MGVHPPYPRVAIEIVPMGSSSAVGNSLLLFRFIITRKIPSLVGGRGRGEREREKSRVLRNLEDPPWTQLGALPEGWEGTPWREGVDAEQKPSRAGGGYHHGGRSYLPGGWGTPMGGHWVR